MKVERIKPEAEFVPVVVTLETQEEVDKLFALLDHCTVNRELDMENWWRPLEKYKSKGYEKYFNKFRGIIR